MTEFRDGSCPLCGLPFGTEELSKDHVFGEQWGGRAKVTTHKTCNNNMGSGAEGRLHRPHSPINLSKMANGLGTKPLPGELPDGTKVDVNLATGEWSPKSPKYTSTQTSSTIDIALSGTPEQVERLIANWNKNHQDKIPTLDELPALQPYNAAPGTDWVTITLTYTRTDLLEVTKKIALGAGVLAFGTDFATTQLAQSLRNATLADEKGDPHAVTVVWEMATEQLKTHEQEPFTVPPPSPVLGSQVVFLPRPGHEDTCVFVYLLGSPLMRGILVDGTLPAGNFGVPILPVLVREQLDKPYEIVNLTEIVMKQTLDRAAAALEED